MTRNEIQPGMATDDNAFEDISFAELFGQDDNNTVINVGEVALGTVVGLAGDAVLISGPVGDHGMAVMVSRSGLAVNPGLKSDSAPLNRMVESLIATLGPQEPPHVLRDPTRGGLATTLNEIAGQSAVNILLRETDIPVRDCVRSAASIIGLDPLYLACEGRLICIVAENQAEAALKTMRVSPHGQDACRIGEVLADPLPGGRSGQVILQTTLGGKRLLPMLEGEQLPRIC